MTHVEEAEVDRLRQRQITEYNAPLNSVTKILDQIFKVFDDSEGFEAVICKILAQIQVRFGFILNKFKSAGLPPAPVLPPQPALAFPAADENAGDGLPGAMVEADQ